MTATNPKLWKQRTPGVTVSLDPSELYWAILRVPTTQPAGLGWRRRRAEEEALRYAFEPLLPLALDEAATRFARCGRSAPHSVVACAIERDRLLARIAGAETGGEGVESVAPSALPSWVMDALPEGGAPGVSAFEFRSGEHESPRRALRRARTGTLVIHGLSLALALLAVGGFRGAAERRREADTARAAAAGLARSALNRFADASGQGASSSSVDHALRLTALARASTQARASTSQGAVPADRARTFEEALAAWPRDLPVRVEQAHIDQASIAIRGRVRDAGDFERLVEGFDGGLAGWREQSKSGSAAAEGFIFSLVLGPENQPGANP